MFHFLSPSRRAQPDLAIDLGTANTRVIMRGEGVIFDEPSLCCFSSAGGRRGYSAAGREVAKMVDRMPAGLVVRRPLARGVLQDLEAASTLLSHALTSVGGKRGLRKPRAMIGIPADATKAEASALRTAARDAGFGQIELTPEPFAAALGSDMSLDTACSSMIIECGAGTTEIAVYSLNGLCLSRSVRQGGLALDAALTEFLHSKHHFLIGGQTAEHLKRELALKFNGKMDIGEIIEVKGRDIHKGGPSVLTLAVSEFLPVFDKHVAPLVEAALAVLGEISPDLAADLISETIVMTGGSACVGLFAQKLSRESGVSVTVADEELLCVSKGLERLLG